jgi:Flp pilus assembly protein TadD
VAIDRPLETAIQHQRSGQLDEAEAAYRQALDLRPNDPEVLRRLGMLYAGSGRSEPAVRYLSRAAEAYVDLALRLAQDRELNAQASRAILARADRVFETAAVVDMLEDCLARILNEAESRDGR